MGLFSSLYRLWSAPTAPATLLGRVPDEHPSRDSRWPAVRALHLKREPVCRACGTKEALEVHHRLPFHTHPDLELDDGRDGTGRDGNLLTLCRDRKSTRLNSSHRL